MRYLASTKGDPFKTLADNLKLKKELKWNPKISFDTGIEKTVNWYLDNKNWWVPLLKEKR